MELVRRLSGQVEGGAHAAGGPPAAVDSVGVLRRQLMNDVILPAVRQGQSFSKVRSDARSGHSVPRNQV